MATKTFKIGETCRGGIITAKTTKTEIKIILKEWDYSQGTNRGSNQSNAKILDIRKFSLSSSRRKLESYLLDLTTSYNVGKILNWIETKVEFEKSFSW